MRVNGVHGEVVRAKVARQRVRRIGVTRDGGHCSRRIGRVDSRGHSHAFLMGRITVSVASRSCPSPARSPDHRMPRVAPGVSSILLFSDLFGGDRSPPGSKVLREVCAGRSLPPCGVRCGPVGAWAEAQPAGGVRSLACATIRLHVSPALDPTTAAGVLLSEDRIEGDTPVRATLGAGVAFLGGSCATATSTSPPGSPVSGG